MGKLTDYFYTRLVLFTW